MCNYSHRASSATEKGRNDNRRHHSRDGLPYPHIDAPFAGYTAPLKEKRSIILPLSKGFVNTPS
jgi:hypothetical protein